ncbi:MAG: SHOCT domain-containing protein [Actinomycetes bacterium]
MSIAEFFWYMLIIFAFMVLLMVLFSIITDIFRNHESSGWVKAAWIFLLVVFPWLTALVYLIVEHKGMTERSVKAAEKQQKAQTEYIQQVAGTTPADQIANAKKLLDDGSISQAEYDQLKAKALSA